MNTSEHSKQNRLPILRNDSVGGGVVWQEPNELSGVPQKGGGRVKMAAGRSGQCFSAPTGASSLNPDVPCSVLLRSQHRQGLEILDLLGSWSRGRRGQGAVCPSAQNDKGHPWAQRRKACTCVLTRTTMVKNHSTGTRHKSITFKQEKANDSEPRTPAFEECWKTHHCFGNW